MFFARSRNTSTAQSLLSGTPGPSPLEAAFKQTKSVNDRVNVVGELVNIKVSRAVDTEFSMSVSL